MFNPLHFSRFLLVLVNAGQQYSNPAAKLFNVN